MALGLFAPFVKLRPQGAPERLKSFGCQIVPISSNLSDIISENALKADVRHIGEGLGTEF